MSTQVGIIKKFVEALTKTKKTGTEAVDEALKAVGVNKSYSALLSEFEAAKGDLSNQDFLEQICGVRINNKDTGAITGSDAGGSTTKTVDSIIPETAAAKELTDDEYNSFTKNGLTVNVTYSTSSSYLNRYFNSSYNTYLEKQKLAVKNLYNWWLPEALDLINESLGINFTDGRASVNEIDIKFANRDLFDPIMKLDVSYDVGRASVFTLTINANALYKLTATDKNGTLDTSNGYSQYDYLKSNFSSTNYKYTDYLDRLFLQAFSEMAVDANLYYPEKLPSAIPTSLWQVVGGYDDRSTDYSVFSDSGYVGYYYAVLRYLAKNYSDGTPDETLPAGLSYNSAKTVLTATTKFTGSKIDLADYVTTVKTVDASKLTKAVYVIGNDLANSLKGGSGADTLNGGKGNDTLTGGSGNDVFIYGAGNDVITDYASGDKISLSAAISKSSVKGSDVIFTVGKNTLTVKNGKGKTLSLIDSAGKSSTTILGGSENSTLMTVTDSTTSPISIGAAVQNVDGSKRKKAIKLTGNDLNNSIVGGSGADTIYGGKGNDTVNGGSGNDKLYGGAGNDKLYGGAGADTLNGGSGNDTLTGGAGNDVFIYEAGNDVIADYAAGDKISLGAAISKSSVKGSDVIFTVGKNTLTVKNGKGKSLSLIDSAGKSSTSVIGGAADVLTLDNSSKSPVTLASDIKTADASSRTKAIKIFGNALDNSIVGGSGNDTLYGGAGNDSLWGNKGADTFLYFEGTGNDVIYGFENSDMLLITGAFSASYNKSKKELSFKVGSTANALTLKDFTATTFNVNGFDYSISGSTLKQK